MQRKNNLTLAYFVVFFKLSLGFITYPLVLRYLNGFELSVYFLFISTGSLFELLDFNFSNNIVRYFSYADAGAKELSNIHNNNYTTELNSKLFMNLRQLSKIYYKFMCLVGLVVIGIGFSVYLYFFALKHHQAYLTLELNWSIYCSASLLGLYFMHYAPSLIGRGFIDSVNKISLITKIVGVVFQIIGLIAGLGLFALALAALVSTALERYLLHRVSAQKFCSDLVVEFSKSEFWQLLKHVWRTNYKLGLMTLSWLFLSRVNGFIAGLAISDVNLLTSYLFSYQMVMILFAIAHVPISNNFSDIAALYVRDKVASMQLFLSANRKSILLMCIMWLGIILCGNRILLLLKLHGTLLKPSYLILIGIIYLCEKQLINHTTMISIRDEVPMFSAYLLSAAGTLLLTLLLAFYFHLGMISFILPQFCVQVSFNYWFWVIYNLKRGNIELLTYVKNIILWQKS